MNPELLKSLLEDDDLGLLTLKPKSSAPTADEHLVSGFNAINEFVNTHGREPAANMATNISEYMLHERLKAIRKNADQCRALNDYDVHGLLPQHQEEKELHSLSDIMQDDDLGLLSSPKQTDDIFEMKHVKPISRAEAEHISKRKQCKDFDQYKDQFKAVHQDIREGKRKLLEFHDTDEQLVAGKYYVLNGVLLLLEKVNIDDARKRKDGRTRCIFENGTESDMLYRSLSKSLYNDGKMVSETNEEAISNFYRSMGGITEEDQKTGYIYVLRSLSQRPEIKSIDNLYKIGLSTTSVAERIANAKNETTYLMADVEIVAEYEAYGINVLAFEQNIHRLFAESCLNVEIVGLDGTKHKPREWFIAPLDVINQAIELTVNRQVHHYRYDKNLQTIVLN